MTSISESIYKITQPVIFSPGTLCDERIFMPCWQYLDISYQAYVPLQWAENLEQMLALANDRLDYFEQAVHLVGFSMGGYLAALVALKRPERIASLTLIGHTAQGLPDAEKKQRETLISAIKQGTYKGMSDKQIDTLLHPINRHRSELSETIRGMEQDIGVATLMNQINATSCRQNLLSKIVQCGIKTHFIAGENDHLASQEQLRQAQQQIKGSTVSILPNAAHMLPIEQPLELARCLAATLNQ